MGSPSVGGPSLLAEIRSEEDEIIAAAPKGKNFGAIDSSLAGGWGAPKQPFSKAISPSLPIGHPKPSPSASPVVGGLKPILINNDLGSFLGPSVNMDTSIWGDAGSVDSSLSVGFAGLPAVPSLPSVAAPPGFSTPGANGVGW